MRAIRHAAAAVAVGTALVVAAAPAMADSGHISINTGSGWTHDASHPLFSVDRITPGWSGSTSLSVRNDSSETANLTLEPTNIVDDENGCDHPESYVDSTCSGANAGELGHELILRVYDQTDSASPIWQGNLYDLESNPTLDSNVASGQV